MGRALEGFFRHVPPDVVTGPWLTDDLRRVESIPWVISCDPRQHEWKITFLAEVSLEHRPDRSNALAVDRLDVPFSRRSLGASQCLGSSPWREYDHSYQASRNGGRAYCRRPVQMDCLRSRSDPA